MAEFIQITELGAGPNADYRYLERWMTDYFLPDRKAQVAYTNSEALRTSTWIVNPGPYVQQQDQNILLGYVSDDQTNWSQPGRKLEGAFGIVRHDASVIEVVSDLTGSRTLWYYSGPEQFVVATSQRLIIKVLGDFQIDQQCVNWMLCSGTLSPGRGWDNRIKCVPPNSTLSVNKSSGKSNLKTEPVHFSHESTAADLDTLQEILEAEITTAFPDQQEVLLPLSGGYDSRALLLLRPTLKKLSTVTWGDADLANDPNGDVCIAQRVARHHGLDHEFMAADQAKSAFEDRFKSFVQAVEGRSDHFGAYQDGLKMWQDFSMSGKKLLIRGDEGFGWIEAHTAFDAMRCVGLNQWRDFGNSADFPALDALPIEVPKHFARQSNESIPAWRDRLYYQFRLPYILASLNTVPTKFMELRTPMLSSKLLKQVMKLRDNDRTEKKWFTDLVDKINIPVPFAANYGQKSLSDALSTPQASSFINQVLKKPLPRDLSFLETLVTQLPKIEPKIAELSSQPSLITRLTRMAPQWLKSMVRKGVMKPKIDPVILAFRVAITTEMIALIHRDLESQ